MWYVEKLPFCSWTYFCTFQQWNGSNQIAYPLRSFVTFIYFSISVAGGMSGFDQQASLVHALRIAGRIKTDRCVDIRKMRTLSLDRRVGSQRQHTGGGSCSKFRQLVGTGLRSSAKSGGSCLSFSYSSEFIDID